MARYTFNMDSTLATDEQDTRVMNSLAQAEAQVRVKEQQNAELKALLQEKQVLVQRLENFLREIEQESARIDQAILQMTRESVPH